MRTLKAALALAGACLLGVPSPAASQGSEPELKAYRFWRAPDVTELELFAVVPFGILSFTREGDTEHASLSGTLEVRDSAGLVLTRQPIEVEIAVPALASVSRLRASTSERFTFRLRPGRYTFAVEITDAGSGRTHRAEREVRAFAARPDHSDLVVAGELSRVDADAEAARGAIVRDGLAIVPSFGGELTTERPTLGLFAEVYRDAARSDSARLWLSIDGVGRPFHFETPRQRRVYPAGGGEEAFAVDLTGLPPGEYGLTLNIQLPDGRLAMTHRLAMLAPGGGAVRMAAETPFDRFDADGLDSIFEPMRLIASGAERADYDVLIDPDAKRLFLERFWQRRAAAAGRSADALRADWEERVAFVERHFAPVSRGERTRKAWHTDRGRIHLRYGAPAERHIQEGGRDQRLDFEVWRYIAGRGDKYVFLDRTGFGDFELVHSTHREEPGVPDWERLFTPEQLERIRQL